MARLNNIETEWPLMVHNAGPQAWVFFDDFNDGPFTSTTSALGKWTLFETDASATELLDLTVPGGVLKITQAANDNDVVSLIANAGIQVDALKTGETLFFGVRFKTEDADDVDLHTGLSIHDTSMAASVPADMAVFQIVEGSASLNLIARKDATNTSALGAGTVADGTWVRAFFAYTPTSVADIGTLEYRIHSNGVMTEGELTTAGNFPDDVVIFPTFQVQNGAAAADVTHIDWMFCFATRADYVSGTG